ncbi:hypothetical protein IQ276_025885 [Desmonostoc muscorum LEGE 12446]|uniref:hypothetical protein n=1 Tax=Desmonostoc muscorum TaxID=1179 RepID=UPI001F36D705|nr:hypothetical protein [Desmonostoc muscorum]MCF2149795.1 hypothetical protein [Desmonostoc muscorum LEGE 12446]
MPDEQPKIIVEVPDRGSYSPLPTQESNKLDDFKKGWINALALPEISGGGDEGVLVQPSAMNEYEQFILSWGQQHPGEILKAGTLSRATRLFDGMQPDELRIIFASMADRGLGEVEGNGDRLGWRWSP